MRLQPVFKVFLALWLFSSTTVSAAVAQELWQGAEVGMTVEDIAALHPNAVVPPDPSRLGTGAIERLRIANFQVSGEIADVAFYFAGESLNQVTLSFDVKSHSDAKYAFDNIYRLLIVKYGDPSIKENGSVGRKSEWYLSNGVNITLLSFESTITIPLLNLVYQSKLAKESDKL